jgi:hypothetical protein
MNLMNPPEKPAKPTPNAVSVLIAIGIVVLIYSVLSSGHKSAPETDATPTPESPRATLLRDLGQAITEQYKKTPYEVSVFGDDSTASLAFDCSDDPHPEDTCFMLYKRYPGEDERKVLKMAGVKKLFFRAGTFKKSWEKNL